MLILNKDNEGISKALDLIYSGEVIIWPSDGAYGFACSALIESAVNYIYTLKSRDKGKPLPVLTNKTNLYDCGEISDKAKKLIDKYWPGWLSLVVPKKPLIADYVTAGKKSVALVCTSEFAAKFTLMSKVPIVATSANISGESEILTLEDAIKTFDGKVKAIINGGKMSGALTTILDLTETPPKIIRDAGIPKNELLEYVSSLG